MGQVIELKNQQDWYEVTLAKKSLAWHQEQKKKKNPLLNFDEAISKEEALIRSFLSRAA